MGALRFILRVVGWLLTPLVAWAASFLGAIVGALLASRFFGVRTGLLLTIVLGLAFAVLGIHAWLRLVRQSPALREALHLEPDGTPSPPDPVADPPAAPSPGPGAP